MKPNTISAVCVLLLISVFASGCGWFTPPAETPSNPNNTFVVEIPEAVVGPIGNLTATTTTTLPEKGGLKTKFVEGDLVSFANLKATDPDGDPVKLLFSPPLDSKGEWQTKTGDAGDYTLNITATDGKLYSAPFIVKITVAAKNLPPVFGQIKDITVKEGDLIDLSPMFMVSDPNGDIVTLAYSGWMSSPKYQTTYDDAGIHTVTLTASDGKDSSQAKVNIIVENVNRAPVLQDFKYDIVVNEGELVTVEPQATDPDSDVIIVTCEKPLNDKCQWQTKKGDEGKYALKITASDGSLSSTKVVNIIVNSANRKPVFTAIPENITVNEGQTAVIKAEATDPEGQKVSITYTQPFADNGTWKTTYGDAGVYDIGVSASDSINVVTKTVKVIVTHTNRPPVIMPMADITVKEGQTVQATAEVRDPDGDPVTVAYSAPLNGDGEWQTNKGDAGEYDVTVTASDGKENVETSFTITVIRRNNAPVMANIAAINAKEGDRIVIPATATDADGDKVTFTFSPPFDKNGVWQTGYEDAGTYNVVVTASDGIDTVQQIVTVNVENFNRPPCIIGINC